MVNSRLDAFSCVFDEGFDRFRSIWVLKDVRYFKVKSQVIDGLS